MLEKALSISAEEGLDLPTEEMIEAGEEIIWGELGGLDLGGFFSASEFASRIYRAMRLCSPKRDARNSPSP